MPEFNVIDWTEELNNYDDTAALVSALDLVISVDTSVAHIAGALAKPVWTLITYSPDFRWLTDRCDRSFVRLKLLISSGQYAVGGASWSTPSSCSS